MADMSSSFGIVWSWIDVSAVGSVAFWGQGSRVVRGIYLHRKFVLPAGWVFDVQFGANGERGGWV